MFVETRRAQRESQPLIRAPSMVMGGDRNETEHREEEAPG